MSILDKTPIIIYGKEGCGKTRNAEYFARAYSKTKIVEADDHSVDGVKFIQHGTMHCAGLDADTLYLTRTPYAKIKAPGALVISFDTALSVLRSEV